MNPRFPIYIPSKGRHESRLTVKVFEKLGVPYRVIVEEHEHAAYAEVIDKRKLLVLDPAYQRDYDAMVPLKDGESRGSGPARNFAWEHSVSKGAAWHWVIDDNVRGFWRMNHNLKVPVGDGTILRCMEDFCLRYQNVAMAGPNYYMWAPRKNPGIKPFTLNTRIYSCNLIRNDLPFRWRGRYNEDTDLSLRLLKAGWCTILFNAFLQWKMTASPGVRMAGGNTEEVYQGGSHRGALEKSKLLVATHPDVARMIDGDRRFKRWHHAVDYTPFQANKLLPIKGGERKRKTDNYGMRLRANPDWTGRALPFSKHGRFVGESAPEPSGFRYGDALPVDFVIPRACLFWIKKDLETNPFDKVVVRSGDRVMDCGSCVGTFAAASMEAGASAVRCYEAFPKNAEALRSNLARYAGRAAVVEAALVADESKTASLALSGFSGAHSIVPRGPVKKAITVPAVTFRAELLAFKPQVIKLDVEGAEYGLLETLRPGDLAGANCVFVEFHPHKEKRARAAAFRAFVEAEGFRVVRDKLRSFTAIR